MQVHAAVGDRVRQGDILAHVHSHDVHDTRAALRSARAEHERALASLDYSRRARDRMKRLFELKTVSLQQLENAESDLRNAEAAVKKAQADVDKEVQHLTEFLEISADDEGHGKQGAHDDLIPIKSTASGIVVERKVSPGSVVSLGQETFVIADPEQLWMLAAFPEASLARLRVGQTASISVRAYPGEVFTGRIVRLGEQLDHETRTLQVRIALSAQGRLKPEMYASARVAPPAGLPAVVIPASAVQEMNGRKVVFLQTAPGRFEPRPVEVAQIVAGQAELRGGISPGDTVVTQGSFLLKSQLAQGAPER
jgi:cobalt-zinc-cadmium efflux system membrane fusion protein